jgi:hypothetical protein
MALHHLHLEASHRVSTYLTTHNTYEARDPFDGQVFPIRLAATANSSIFTLRSNLAHQFLLAYVQQWMQQVQGETNETFTHMVTKVIGTGVIGGVTQEKKI